MIVHYPLTILLNFIAWVVFSILAVASYALIIDIFEKSKEGVRFGKYNTHYYSEPVPYGFMEMTLCFLVSLLFYVSYLVFKLLLFTVYCVVITRKLMEARIEIASQDFK